MGRPNEAPMPDPLAYYLTWSTYGTWLPGDARGWVRQGRGMQPPDPIRTLEAAARMTEIACRLNPEQRALVEKTVAEHCQIRRWELFAVNCRSNHIHVVVAAPLGPEAVRNQLKAWCTRKLKELERNRRGDRPAPAPPPIPARSASEGTIQNDNVLDEDGIRENWWTERGSRLYINEEADLEAVIQYVRDGQDDPQHQYGPQTPETGRRP